MILVVGQQECVGQILGKLVKIIEKLYVKRTEKYQEKYTPIHFNQMSQIIENTRQEENNNKQDQRI
jgi:hypothetical protein